MKLRIPELTLRNFLVVCVIAVIVGSLSFYGIAHYTTTNPSYCLSCHGVGDTPNIGYESEIHPSFAKVSCLECHADNGTGATHAIAEGYQEGYSAEPERVSANCIRCHSEVLEGDLESFEFNIMNINIPHKTHLDMGLLCTDCHDNITHDKNKQKTNRPKMDSCMRCHDHEANNCYSCHNEENLELPLMETIPYEEACTSCHSTFKTKSIEIYDLTFSHQLHLAKSVDCNTCHSNNEKHGVVIDKERCDDCHQMKIPHEKNWKTTHKKLAKSNPASCMKCHEQSSCKSCHQVDIPHSEDWLGLHFEEAKKNVTACANCHKTKDKCAECHEFIKPSTHGDEWIKKHPTDVKTKGNYCKMCHEVDYCRSCHITPPSG